MLTIVHHANSMLQKQTHTHTKKTRVSIVTAPPSQFKNTSEISKYNQDGLRQTVHLKDCLSNHANKKAFLKKDAP